MTTPGDLPVVYSGMVWDGVTEYSEDLPTGVTDAYTVFLSDNGYRVLVGHARILNGVMAAYAPSSILGGE